MTRHETNFKSVRKADRGTYAVVMSVTRPHIYTQKNLRDFAEKEPASENRQKLQIDTKELASHKPRGICDTFACVAALNVLNLLGIHSASASSELWRRFRAVDSGSGCNLDNTLTPRRGCLQKTSLCFLNGKRHSWRWMHHIRARWLLSVCTSWFNPHEWWQIFNFVAWCYLGREGDCFPRFFDWKCLIHKKG